MDENLSLKLEDRETLKIYDPYYCMGNVVKQLASLGSLAALAPLHSGEMIPFSCENLSVYSFGDAAWGHWRLFAELKTSSSDPNCFREVKQWMFTQLLCQAMNTNHSKWKRTTIKITQTCCFQSSF